MTRPTDPAFARPASLCPDGSISLEGETGMSVRAYFAGQALVALADKLPTGPGVADMSRIHNTAQACVLYADALVDALNRSSP